MKKFTKIFSILFLAVICSFNFVACKNNDNKQASNNLTSDNINTQISVDDQTAENTSTEGSNNTETANDEENNTEEPELKIDLISGIYKFANYDLTFDDIFYENEAELLSFFETRDLNGVYDAVYRLGFDNFINSITTKTIEDETFNNFLHLTKMELNGNDLLRFANLYEYKTNIYTYFNSTIIYHNNNGLIVPMNTNNTNTFPYASQIIINEDGSISLLYQFSYINSESNEVVNSPLYVKTNIELYNRIEPTDFNEEAISYKYAESSAIIESKNGFVDTKDAMSKLELEEMFSTLDMHYSVTDFLAKSELYFSNDKTLYIAFTSADNNIIITDKSSEANEYSILNSIKFNIVNEYYDLTLSRNILNIEIEIDENTTFKCNFFAQF